MVLHVSENRNFLVIDDCTQQEYNQILISYTKQAKNAKFDQRVKRGFWDGNIKFVKGKYLPAGTYSYLQRLCKEFGFSCKINGLETLFDLDIKYDEFKDWCDEFFSDTVFQPRYYQIDAAYKILKSKRCLVDMCTSSGKTLTSFIVFAYLLTHKGVNKILMVVPTVQLVIQSSGDFMAYNSDKLPINIQQVYSGAKYAGETNIVVGTFQSLVKETQEFFSQFQCIFCDECHRSTASQEIKILEQCDYPYKFGMSGSLPSTKYADGLTLQSHFGPVVVSIKSNQLQEEGFISNCNIIQTTLDYTSEQQKEAMKNAKKQLVKNEKGGDMYNIEKKFVMESDVRFNTMMKMISSTTKNTLVLFQHIDYGKKIYTWMKENTSKQVYYIDGEIDKSIREEIRQRMDNYQNVVLVASFGTTSTGVSIDAIFNIFFVESFKSTTVILQSVGRGLRKNNSKNKDFVTIYDICDDLYKGCYHMNHARERRKIYSEQKFPYEIKHLKL